ncbi:MAG: hypothetical protein K0B87_00605 [Candidatus Syntrophosphaera sp.]|nr:hypothetical protein [Candidatus Syntrophosphaera sp.]
MLKQTLVKALLVLAAMALLQLVSDGDVLPFFIPVLLGHCDTVKGPVVQAAVKALDTGNVDLVLVWVQPQDEAAIREAFRKTLDVRKLDPQAKELADMYFFETLVRIHRAGEGAPYEGLKPEDTEAEPGIEAADEAVRTGRIEELAKEVSTHVEHGILEKFAAVQSTRQYPPDDVGAGRRHVQAYVTFIHYVEAIHKALHGSGEHHGH